MSALNLFGGGDVQLAKDAITEFYKNVSLGTLSSKQQVEFDKIFDLTAHINFEMKHSILVNTNDQDEAIKTNNGNVKETYEFFKKPPDEDAFEREITEDILKDELYEHKKGETLYVEPTVEDAAIIEDQVNKKIDDFLQLASEFNKVDAVATKQKKIDYYDKLFEDVEEKPDKRQKRTTL